MARGQAITTSESGKLFGRRILRLQPRVGRPTAAKCSETAAITICVRKASKQLVFNDNPNDCAKCSDCSGDPRHTVSGARPVTQWYDQSYSLGASQR